MANHTAQGPDMKRLLAGLFSKPSVDVTDDHALELQSEMRALQLELDERQRRIATLEADLSRQERRTATQVGELVAARVERLLTDAAGPVTQIQTQVHLVAQGVDVQVRDVVAVASRLVSVLEQAGLHLMAVVGERVAYDPDQHVSLGSGAPPAPGQSVVVRIPGAALDNRLIRKAMVEVVGD